MAEAWQGDPGYLAALRSVALSGANDEATIRYRQAALRRRMQDALPEIARRGVLQRQAIGLGYESRGFARSTSNQDTQQQNRYDEALQSTGLQNDTAEGIGDYETQLAQIRARNLGSVADAEGLARLRDYQRTALLQPAATVPAGAMANSVVGAKPLAPLAQPYRGSYNRKYA